MPVLEFITSSGLGSLLGMRHALEPDHLAAVSTLVTGERSGYARGPARRRVGRRPHAVARCRRRACWWCCARKCRRSVVGPVRAGRRPDARRARRRARSRWPCGRAASARRTRITTAASSTTHAGATPHVHVGRWTLARRPLIVGAVHGLAGSGALTALVLADAAVDGSAPHLHGAVRTRIDARHGGAVGTARLAARAARREPDARARRCRWRSAALSIGAGRVLGLPAHFTRTVQLTGTGLRER